MRVVNINSKIKSQESLKLIVERLKKKKKRIVFTNGCFDLIHPGHIAYLGKAKKAGDILIIGLNSDRSVRRLKGKGRPLTPQRKRAELLSSLGVVDFITIFNGLTPINLIKKLKPHVLAKGADWKKKDIVGADFVESYGGKIKRIPYLKGYSTSSIIKNISKKFS